MSLNLRRHDEHNYTGYTGQTTTDVTVYSYTATSCALGHTYCVITGSSPVTAKRISINTTTKTTVRPTPLNTRSKNHSHRYDKTSYGGYTGTTISGAVALYGVCGAGHSDCAGLTDVTNATSLSISVSTDTITYNPPPPVNIRAKIRHNHSLQASAYTTETAVPIITPITCPAGHSNCQRSYSTVNITTGGGASSVTSSDAYE
jgi:hypothetical protein